MEQWNSQTWVHIAPWIQFLTYEYDEDTLNDSFFNDYQRKPSAEHNWIEFDFIDKKVALTGYSIRSSGGPADNEHAASWKIIASNDQETWVTIDEKQRNEDLNGRYATQIS